MARQARRIIVNRGRVSGRLSIRRLESRLCPPQLRCLGDSPLDFRINRPTRFSYERDTCAEYGNTASCRFYYFAFWKMMRPAQVLFKSLSTPFSFPGTPLNAFHDAIAGDHFCLHYRSRFCNTSERYRVEQRRQMKTWLVKRLFLEIRESFS